MHRGKAGLLPCAHSSPRLDRGRVLAGQTTFLSSSTGWRPRTAGGLSRAFTALAARLLPREITEHPKRRRAPLRAPGPCAGFACPRRFGAAGRGSCNSLEEAIVGNENTGRIRRWLPWLLGAASLALLAAPSLTR